MNRVAERLEERVGTAPDEVSKVIRTKFVSMVEGHYLVRVKPPATEMTLPSPGNEEGMGGGEKMPLFGKFELPTSLTGIYSQC